MTWESHWQSPSFVSNCLLPASWAYGLGVRLRRHSRPTRIDGLQVVSIGNLLVGGAGKTPVVLYLAERALAAGRRVAVLSRGYARKSPQPVSWLGAGIALPSVADVGDEPRLIARRLPKVHLFIDADRVAAAQAAKAAGCEVAFLDDGYQHQRLHRDVNVLIDAGIGNGRLLPAGPLREPTTASTRADVLWARDGATSLHAPQALRVEARHEATSLLDPLGGVLPISTLQGRRVVAFAGLARPVGFLSTLTAAGANVVESHLFADHHPFTGNELARLERSAAKHDAWLLTTEKDQERLPCGFKVWVPRLSIRIISGGDALSARLGW